MRISLLLKHTNTYVRTVCTCHHVRADFVFPLLRVRASSESVPICLYVYHTILMLLLLSYSDVYLSSSPGYMHYMCADFIDIVITVCLTDGWPHVSCIHFQLYAFRSQKKTMQHSVSSKTCTIRLVDYVCKICVQYHMYS